jgi:NitT/TauT family transport system substrate-binding protein
MTHLVPRRKFLSLFVPLFGLAGCTKRPERSFRIATYTWPGYEPLFLARELGYFGGHSIQLLELPSVAECLLAFQNRLVDAITLTLDEVVRLARFGHEPRIVLMLDYSSGADVILARPEITSLAELKGGLIAVENNAVGAFFLARALESSGLQLSDVKTIAHRADRMEAEFAAGRIDAAVTYDPYRANLVARGARLIFDSTSLPNEIVDTLIVRRATVENPPSALSALPEAWFRAVEYIRAQPEDAARRMAPRHHVSGTQFSESLRGLQLLGRHENQSLLSSPTSTLPATLQRLSAFLAKSELITGPVDTAVLPDGRLLAARSP